MPQIDDGLDHRLVVGMLADIGDEAAVDLQFVDGEAFQIVQGRIAGAEIVDGNNHAHPPDMAQHFQGLFHVLHGDAFGDFQLKLGRRHSGLIQDGGNNLDQPPLLELGGRQVDRDFQRRQSLAGPDLRLLARPMQNPAPDGLDQIAALGHGDKIRRADPSSRRMQPADQRLAPDDFAGGDFDQRLEMHPKLTGSQGAAQILFDQLAGLDFGIHFGHIIMIIVAPLGLGAKHRQIGIFQQLLGIDGIVGRDGDADRGRGQNLVFLQPELVGNGGDDGLGHRGGVAGFGQMGQDDGEFVAAQAGHGVGFPHAAGQALGHRLQQQIADMVAQGVVDVLELVQIQKHQRHPVAAPLADRQGLAQAFLKQFAVGQPG